MQELYRLYDFTAFFKSSYDISRTFLGTDGSLLAPLRVDANEARQEPER